MSSSNNTPSPPFASERRQATEPVYDSVYPPAGPRREDLEAVNAALHEVVNTSHPLHGPHILTSPASPPPAANALQKMPLRELKGALDAANFFGAKSPAWVSSNLWSAESLTRIRQTKEL